MCWFNLLSKNKDVILNRVKYYKRKWQREEETYLKKKKIKKREYRENRYHNMSEEKKQRLKEY